MEDDWIFLGDGGAGGSDTDSASEDGSDSGFTIVRRGRKGGDAGCNVVVSNDGDAPVPVMPRVAAVAVPQPTPPGLFFKVMSYSEAFSGSASSPEDDGGREQPRCSEEVEKEDFDSCEEDDDDTENSSEDEDDTDSSSDEDTDSSSEEEDEDTDSSGDEDTFSSSDEEYTEIFSDEKEYTAEIYSGDEEEDDNDDVESSGEEEEKDGCESSDSDEQSDDADSTGEEDDGAEVSGEEQEDDDAECSDKVDDVERTGEEDDAESAGEEERDTDSSGSGSDMDTDSSEEEDDDCLVLGEGADIGDVAQNGNQDIFAMLFPKPKACGTNMEDYIADVAENGNQDIFAMLLPKDKACGANMEDYIADVAENGNPDIFAMLFPKEKACGASMEDCEDKADVAEIGNQDIFAMLLPKEKACGGGANMDGYEYEKESEHGNIDDYEELECQCWGFTCQSQTERHALWEDLRRALEDLLPRQLAAEAFEPSGQQRRRRSYNDVDDTCEVPGTAAPGAGPTPAGSRGSAPTPEALQRLGCRRRLHAARRGRA